MDKQTKTKKSVRVYTDGACSGNPGPGGYGIILIYGGHIREASGGEPHTTNNRMELTGALKALEMLKEPCRVELYSDSKYLVDGIEKGWARRWRENGWKRAKGEDALNPDLWQGLLDLLDIHDVRFTWVRGHADNEYNNRCDGLAVAECAKMNKRPEE